MSNKNKTPKWVIAVGGGLAIWAASSTPASPGTVPKTSSKPEVILTSASTNHKHRDDIAFCESTNNDAAVNPAGLAYGRYQFEDALWHEVAGSKYRHANQAPRSVQDDAYEKAHAKYGDRPWVSSKPCWSVR